MHVRMKRAGMMAGTASYRRLVAACAGLVLVAGAGVLTAGMAPAAEAATGPVTVSGVAAPGGSETQFNQISCASAGNCTAIGTYFGNPVVLTETDGTWASTVQPAMPANATSSGNLESVSCDSAATCTVAGWYAPAARARYPALSVCC